MALSLGFEAANITIAPLPLERAAFIKQNENKMNLHLKSGDKCFVRVHTGEIVEAIYDDWASKVNKSHAVIVNGDICLASENTRNGGSIEIDTVRFVYPPKEAMRQHLESLKINN